MSALHKQHLIDPEICIRCYSCEAACPKHAIQHDDANVVVDAASCNFCMDCIPVCPTGSIDNWRVMPRLKAYNLTEQLSWDTLPAELTAEQLAVEGAAADAILIGDDIAAAPPRDTSGETGFKSAQYGAALPPWSAAHAYTNLYGPKAADKSIAATVAGNVRVTEVGKDYDTHHIVLDFGATPFPVLEGQSIAVVPPGVDDLSLIHISEPTRPY